MQKSYQANPLKTQQTMDNRATTDRTPAPNSTLAIGGVSSTNRPRLQRGRIKFAFVTQQTLFHFMIALIDKAA
ncbi:MAG: hypothetical protein ACK5JQ_04135 [Bacteroidota bacterium]